MTFEQERKIKQILGYNNISSSSSNYLKQENFLKNDFDQSVTKILSRKVNYSKVKKLAKNVYRNENNRKFFFDNNNEFGTPKIALILQIYRYNITKCAFSIRKTLLLRFTSFLDIFITSLCELGYEDDEAFEICYPGASQMNNMCEFNYGNSKVESSSYEVNKKSSCIPCFNTY